MTTPESIPSILPMLYSSERGSCIADPPHTVVTTDPCIFRSGPVRLVVPGNARLRPGRLFLSVTICRSISLRDLISSSVLVWSTVFIQTPSEL